MSLNIPRRALPVLLIPLALAGCGKVQEAASEKAAEKMIEPPSTRTAATPRWTSTTAA
jgi:hypothetical protein